MRDIATLWIPPPSVLAHGVCTASSSDCTCLGVKAIYFHFQDMEKVSFWSNCYLFRVFSFQEVLDWRFLVLGDFLLVSFVNCT
ncbi:hypothetical protein GQ457_15G007900 [Hibiscus cannabinus]